MVDPEGKFAIFLPFIPPTVKGLGFLASAAAAAWAAHQLTKDENCDEDKEKCKKRKDYCLAFCQYELDMPGRRDNFGPHRACVRRCMIAGGCNNF